MTWSNRCNCTACVAGLHQIEQGSLQQTAGAGSGGDGDLEVGIGALPVGDLVLIEEGVADDECACATREHRVKL